MRVLVADALAAEAIAARRLAGDFPEVEFLCWPACGHVTSADLLLTFQIPEDLVLPADLRAVLCYGAGAEHILADARLSAEVPVLRLMDAGQEERMRDHALAAAYSRLVRLDDYRALQLGRRWPAVPLPLSSAGDLRVAVLGLGVIGGGVAEALGRHGFSVTGWARRQRNLSGVKVVTGEEGLVQALTGADLVIDLLPAAPELVDLLDASTLSLVARGGMIASFGRGEHLHLAALRRALDAVALCGAWLDVFPTEPPPADSWVWAHPRVTVTPHVAGIPIPERGAAAVARVVAALREGSPLPGIVRAAVRGDH